MFITKKHLSRRTFLRGAGVAIALPFLDAMVPARTALAGTAANPVQRFGFIYFPNGSIMKHWTPEQQGIGFEFSPILKQLEPFRHQVTILTGLQNSGEPSHSVATAAFLSGTVPPKGSKLLLATTADQLIAQKIGKDIPYASMEFATEDHSSHLGSCPQDYLCSYMNTISWRTPTQPLSMELNPSVVFERIFGGGEATTEERKARLEQRTSILDNVKESLHEVSRGLDAGDRAKLNEYLESIREVEQQVVQAEKQRNENLLDATEKTPFGIPELWEQHVNLMFDLNALAFQGNLTRVSSFMMARELSTMSFPQIGVADGHHGVSHNNNVPEQIAKKEKIDIYFLRLFVRFLERLQSVSEGDGNMLDHSLLIYGGGMSDGNLHVHTNLPIVVVGGAAGALKGGRHVKVRAGTPASNLWLTLMNMAGIEAERFGDSTGTIEI